MKKPLARPAAWIQAAGRRGLHANQEISSIDDRWDAFAAYGRPRRKIPEAAI